MIYPKCKLKDGRARMAPALRYDGYLMPCCHFGNWGVIEMLKERMGEELVEQMHITNGTLDEINKSDAFKWIEESFTSDNPLSECKHLCGSPDNLDESLSSNNSNYTLIRMDDK
tara:strand:- start:2098 stop:2439 length:342 start_codon:yes stop_codon:yes gene_type:complete